MNRILRTTIQVTLLTSAIWGLVGCFYWPAKEKAFDGIRPQDQIGPGKELALGQSTHEDIRRVLRTHTISWSADGQWAVVQYTTQNGYWVWPLCAYAEPEYNRRAVRLHFTNNHLDRVQVFDNWYQAYNGTGIYVMSTPPASP